jgi:hypothetical protein
VRLPLLLALVVALAVGPSAPSDAASGRTSLTITYRPQGARASDMTTWTLRCNPPAGTLARPARACRRLAAGDARLFAPVPRNAVCTEIYGGPQTARVAGTVAGRRVSAAFNRVNGCEIARWNRLAPWLLPRGRLG